MFGHCFLHCKERSTTVWSRCVVHHVVLVGAWVQLFRKPLGWYCKYTFRSLVPVWIMLLDWVWCNLPTAQSICLSCHSIHATCQRLQKVTDCHSNDIENRSVLCCHPSLQRWNFIFYFLLTTYLLINWKWSFREGAVYQFYGFV